MDGVLSGSMLNLGGEILNKVLIKSISALQKYLFKPRKEGIRAILTYHGVSVKEEKNCVSLRKFISHLDYLNKTFEIIKLSELIEVIHLNNIDGRDHVAITFDDAYENFWEHAYPELRRRKIPAALFVPVGFVGLYNSWDFENSHDSSYLKIMNWEKLLEIDKNLIEIGAHGYNHKRMAQLGDNELEIEIRKTKEILEDKLKQKIEGFAYPYGELVNSDERVIAIL
jgi:peptidoglycan/xylan/chitin deacetylase (PgdA/CDA1 family)